MTTTAMLVLGALFALAFGKGLIRDVLEEVGFPCWACRRGWAWSHSQTGRMRVSFDFDANPNAYRDFQKNRKSYFYCRRCRAAWTYCEANGWKSEKH